MSYNAHGSLRETSSFPQANVECDRQRHDREGNVLSAVQRSQYTSACRVTGMEDLVQRWSLLLPHLKSVTAFTKRSCQLSTNLQINWKTTTAYEHFVHEWGSISPW